MTDCKSTIATRFQSLMRLCLTPVDVGGNDRDSRWGDAWNPRCLAEGRGAYFCEPLDHLARETGDRLECEGLGNRAALLAAKRSTEAYWRRRYPSYLNSVSRAGDIQPGIASGARMSSPASKVRQCDLGPLQGPRRRTRAPLGTVTVVRRTDSQLRRTAHAPLKAIPALVGHEADRASARRQAKIGVVDAQQEPVLGARREHPVRLEAPCVVRSSTRMPM